MGSIYLNKLSRDDYQLLVETLWQSQNQKCFICDEPIDSILHIDTGTVDVDHMKPLTSGGADDPANFALTHRHCNRSKQAGDLRVARLLSRFDRLGKECPASPSSPNLGDVLSFEKGGCYSLPLKVEGTTVVYSLPDIGNNQTFRVQSYTDSLSKLSYFFAVLPIEYLTHDDRINPRAIAATSLRRLIEEFHGGFPQLHVALAWIDATNGQARSQVKVFDGQHKVAAQVLLGVRNIPVRIFINPDVDTLLTANTHAGTTLRQVAFDKSVQRRLGNQLLQDRINMFLEARGMAAGDRSFSEQQLLDHYRGSAKEVKRYILDGIRDAITHNSDNRLKDFVELGGRGGSLPISYNTIERTFYSFFVGQDPLSTSLEYRVEQGENPRDLEVEQIVRLMNVIAVAIYIGQFDSEVGTHKLESRLATGENIPPLHLRAYRMGKEEVMYNWLKLVRLLIQNAIVLQQGKVDDSRLFQSRFSEAMWERITCLVQNLAGLPLWISRPLGDTAFAGKRNYDYWQMVFATGKAPDGTAVLTEGINVIKLSSPLGAD